jgi:hypothetical protein
VDLPQPDKSRFNCKHNRDSCCCLLYDGDGAHRLLTHSRHSDRTLTRSRAKVNVADTLIRRLYDQWHRADIKLRALLGRYGVESGHHWLVMSISAFDPKRTSKQKLCSRLTIQK